MCHLSTAAEFPKKDREFSSLRCVLISTVAAWRLGGERAQAGIDDGLKGLSSVQIATGLAISARKKRQRLTSFVVTLSPHGSEPLLSWCGLWFARRVCTPHARKVGLTRRSISHGCVEAWRLTRIVEPLTLRLVLRWARLFPAAARKMTLQPTLATYSRTTFRDLRRPSGS